MNLILASASPRRREILTNAGFAFTVLPVDIDESVLPGESPADYALRLATEKAAAAAALLLAQNKFSADTVVLAADTTVTIDDQILGKPADAADAHRMLSLLSGRTHNVITAICLRTPTEQLAEFVTTAVTFAPLTESDIAGYVATNEPMDKAGAYAIQGRASRWVSSIEGCYFNVVGLPIQRVTALLASLGRRGGLGV
jgi:septum formation protein